VSLRDRRDARPHTDHLPCHPDVRRPTVQGPAAIDGAHAGTRPVRPGGQIDARFDTYKRGDIVVFTPPPDWSREDDTPFIKRVIGLGGETVEIRDGDVFIDGTKLDEEYLFAAQSGDPTQPTTVPGDEHRWVIPAGELFLMGDHRANSADSRMFGPVEAKQVIGRAWLRYWPLDTFGILQTPTYPELAPATP
jgi:signal peptidase I